jgi:hypothetical protein
MGCFRPSVFESLDRFRAQGKSAKFAVREYFNRAFVLWRRLSSTKPASTITALPALLNQLFDQRVTDIMRAVKQIYRDAFVCDKLSLELGHCGGPEASS